MGRVAAGYQWAEKGVGAIMDVGAEYLRVRWVRGLCMGIGHVETGCLWARWLSGLCKGVGRTRLGICWSEGWKLWVEVAKVQEVAHIPSFYPRGAKLSLFLLYAQQFPRYGPIFKIATFGHETWQVTKVPEVARFALRLDVFQIIEVFGFSIGSMMNLKFSKKCR